MTGRTRKKSAKAKMNETIVFLNSEVKRLTDDLNIAKTTYHMIQRVLHYDTAEHGTGVVTY